jgi:hypothetical protein
MVVGTILLLCERLADRLVGTVVQYGQLVVVVVAEPELFADIIIRLGGTSDGPTVPKGHSSW